MLGVMACNCNPATLEVEFLNGEASIPFVVNSPSKVGGLCDVIQHNERNLQKQFSGGVP